MDMKKSRKLSRRRFIATFPCFLFIEKPINRAAAFFNQNEQGPSLWEPFTSEEKEIIEHSGMAKDIENYAGKGYSCAESIYVVSLNAFDRPEEWLHAAAVFGGGLGKRDLCGLLTGGMMAIGVAGGKLHSDRKDAKDWAREASLSYWDWWESMAPLHCRDLRTKYEGKDEYLRMCKRAAFKIEQLIEQAIE